MRGWFVLLFCRPFFSILAFAFFACPFARRRSCGARRCCSWRRATSRMGQRSRRLVCSRCENHWSTTSSLAAWTQTPCSSSISRTSDARIQRPIGAVTMCPVSLPGYRQQSQLCVLCPAFCPQSHPFVRICFGLASILSPWGGRVGHVNTGCSGNQGAPRPQILVIAQVPVLFDAASYVHPSVFAAGTSSSQFFVCFDFGLPLSRHFSPGGLQS